MKTLNSNQVALSLKNKHFSLKGLENLEMRICYRERFKQCFGSVTLSTEFNLLKLTIVCFSFLDAKRMSFKFHFVENMAKLCQAVLYSQCCDFKV